MCPLNSPRFARSWPWFAAEGTIDGKPSLFRGRQSPSEFIGNSAFPFLFVITYSYDSSDETGLPSESQYADISSFERQYLDPLEEKGCWIIAFIKTWNGRVQYFLYVSEVQVAAEAFEDFSVFPLGLASASDPEWREYRAFLRGSQRQIDQIGPGMELDNETNSSRKPRQ